jgi:tetratricopeptide (TPR) repeat protein
VLGDGLSGFFAHRFGSRPSVRRFRGFVLLSLLAVGLLGTSASAQTLTSTEREQLEAQKAKLFQQILRQPDNLDVAFAYADVSAKLGDNEAAVSALERMLFFNPNLPRVQLELGTLYFRMGSYEISRSYFEKARAANPPPEVAARIDTYMAQISKNDSPQQLTGYFFAGVQHQSDANIAPGSPLVHSPVGDVLLNSQFVKKSDENFFATGSVLYSYDLGNQDRDAIEVVGTGFANHYGSVTRLDLGLVEATVGPRFNFSKPLPWLETLSLKPYGIANDVSLGGNQYFHTFGVGTEGTALLWDDLRLKSVFEFRSKGFNNAPDRPVSNGLDGSDKLVSVIASKPITANPYTELNLEFDFLNQDTKLAYYSNNSYAGSAAYRIRYDDPIKAFSYPWETTIFASRSWANYSAPDPCCVTGPPAGLSQRFDRRWRFGVSQSIQVAKDVAVVLQVQRDIVSSNLPIYGYTSNSVLIGPQIRF